MLLDLLPYSFILHYKLSNSCLTLAQNVAPIDLKLQIDIFVCQLQFAVGFITCSQKQHSGNSSDNTDKIHHGLANWFQLQGCKVKYYLFVPLSMFHCVKLHRCCIVYCILNLPITVHYYMS